MLIRQDLPHPIMTAARIQPAEPTAATRTWTSGKYRRWSEISGSIDGSPNMWSMEYADRPWSRQPIVPRRPTNIAGIVREGGWAG